MKKSGKIKVLRKKNPPESQENLSFWQKNWSGKNGKVVREFQNLKYVTSMRFPLR